MDSSEATRLAAANYLERAVTTCTGVLQTTVHYASQTTVALVGTEAGRLPPHGSLHWVWSAALHEMLQGMKSYLFSAHVAARMVHEDINTSAATAKVAPQMLPDVLTHERWLRLPWLTEPYLAQGYEILLGLHRIRKCLHRTRGVVHAQEAGKQGAIILHMLQLSVSGAPKAPSLQVQSRLRSFDDGDSVILSVDEIAAAGLTLWILVQQSCRPFRS